MLRRRGIRPARLIELGSNEATAHAVAAGAGVALLPAVVLRDPVAMGRVRVAGLTGDPDILRPLYRLELATRPRGPALPSFVEMVVSPPTPAARRARQARARPCRPRPPPLPSTPTHH